MNRVFQSIPPLVNDGLDYSFSARCMVVVLKQSVAVGVRDDRHVCLHGVLVSAFMLQWPLAVFLFVPSLTSLEPKMLSTISPPRVARIESRVSESP